MARRGFRVVCLLLALAVLGSSLPRTAVSAQAVPEQQTYLPLVLLQESRIAFVSYRDGSWGLYTVRPDGSGLRFLAPGSSAEGAEPTWLPDRTHIAFGCADGDGICAVEADGSGLRRLPVSQSDHSLSWSPDGSSVACTYWVDGNTEVYVTDVRTGLTTNLTRNPAADTQPDWSPDGQWIAFVSNRSGVDSVYTMRADGSDVQKVSADEAAWPAWSPDGAHFSFSRRFRDILLVGRNIQAETKIGSMWPHRGPLVWSPDGTAILFQHYLLTDGCWAIDVLRNGNSAGGWTHRQVASCGSWQDNLSPAWSPDGTQVAYVSGLDHNIHIVGLAPGSIDRNITDHADHYDRSLAWATRYAIGRRWP